MNINNKSALLRWAVTIITTITLPLLSQSPQTNCDRWLRFEIKTEANELLAHAEVFIEALHLLSKTNEKGYLEWTNLCDSTYEVEVWHQGQHQHYELQSNTFHRLIWKPTDAVRFAEMHITKLNTGRRSDHLYIPDLKAATSSSISEKLAEMPMIRLQQTGNSIQKPMLQGLSGLRLPLFQDGIRIQGQGWGNDHAPELGRWGVQEITIKKGAEALKYASDAWGNYIDLSFRPGYHSFENHGEILNGYQTNGHLYHTGIRYSQGGSSPTDGFYVSAQYLTSGDYAVPGTILSNTAFNESSIYGGWSHGWSKAIHKIDFSYFTFSGGIYLGSHIGNLSDLNRAIQNKVPTITSNISQRIIQKPLQTANHSRVSFERIPISKNGIYVRLGYQKNQRREFDPHRNPLNQFPQLNLWVHNFQSYASKHLQLGKIKFETGLQYEMKWQDWGGYFLAPQYQGRDAGFFLHIPHNGQNWNQNFTLRYDYIWRNTTLKNEAFTEHFKGLSLAYSILWNKHHSKNHIHVTLARRAPSVNERYSAGVHHGSASYEQGNPLLEMEKGIKLEWERSSQWGKLQYRTNFYALHASNFIHLNPQVEPILSVRGAFPHYIYEGLPTVYLGANFWSGIKWGEHQLEARFDMLWGAILKENRYPTQMPPPSFSIEWHRNFKKFETIFRQTWVSQMPFYTENTDLAPPPQAYALSNLFLRIPKLTRKADLRLEMGIRNIFNANYREYLDRFRYFTPQIGRSIFMQLIWNIHHHRKHQEL